MRSKGSCSWQLLDLDAPSRSDQPEAVGQKLSIQVEEAGAQA